MDGAFAGLRVVDTSDRLSGAYCARLFGDQGADVLLLEDAAGSPLRAEPPFLDDRPGVERSLLHAFANANKRSVVLPWADPRRASLLRKADVVVVSSRQDAEDVARHVGPRCVTIAVTPYGLTTSMSDAPGTDLTTSALTGWALTNALDGEPPLRPTRHQSQYLAGLMAYTGGAAAILDRDTTGEGQVVDVCELEPMLWMAAPSILAETSGAPRGKPRGHLNVFNAPVPARDGHATLTFSRPHFWTEAMRALGLDDLADDPRYLDRDIRQAESEPLAKRIEAAVARQDRWDLFHDLAERRCTVGVVLDTADIATSEHLEARDVLGTLTVEERPLAVLEAPCRMEETPWRLHGSAPRLGEHTDEVLTELDALEAQP